MSSASTSTFPQNSLTSHSKTRKIRELSGGPVVSLSVSVTQSCLTLCDPMDSSPPGSSLHLTAELFQVLKDDAVKVLPSICRQIWKMQQWPQNWKMLVFIPILKKGNAKEYSNYYTIVLISQASKVMLKILQASPSRT